MDNFKPTFGIEPTNKYDKARQDLIQAMNSIRELTEQEQRTLATEFFGAAKVATLLRLLNMH